LHFKGTQFVQCYCKLLRSKDSILKYFDSHR
jgi:hypothetical protein